MERIWLLIVLGIVLFGQTNSQIARSQVQRETIMRECNGKAADVYFVIDASTSIFIEDFERLRQLVREIVKQFHIGTNEMRVGALVYSRSYQVAFDLDRFHIKADILEAITESNIPYLTGITNTHDALRYARTNGKFRSNVTKVIVVITDGYSREPTSTAAEARKARQDGFYLFVIGTGDYTDEREWRAIASDPDDRFMYNVTDYRNLNRLYQTIPFRICQLRPIIKRPDTCTIQQDADLIFVAGPRGVDAAVPIIQELVNKMDAGPARLTLTMLLGACSAESRALQDPRLLCTDFGETSVVRQDTYVNLLEDLRVKARDARSRRSRVNQVAILFIDDVSMRDNPLGILRKVQQVRYGGIEIYVVDLGVIHNTRFLQSIASSPEKVFNTSHPQGINYVTSKILQAACSDLNGSDLHLLGIVN